MKSTLDKIFNPYSLAVINVIIILLAEFAGGGRLFFNSGLIHLIAVLFIVLSVARIFVRYYTFDPILERFLYASLAAFIVFTVSHIVEYTSMMVFHIYQDATFANVVNFYLISILTLAVGAELFLKVYHGRGARLIMLLSGIIAAIFVLIAAFLINPNLISLEPDSWMPYTYALALLGAGFYGIFKMLQIRKLVTIAVGFVNYLVAAIALIMLAAMFDVFYEFLEHYLGIADYQIIYFSHFAFYAALSLMFLAYAKLSYLGEFYEEIKKIAQIGR